MRYILRQGLFLENVFGKHLLIADQEARKHCTWLTELDTAGAEILEGIIAGISCEEMAAGFSEEYESSQQEILEIIKAFLVKMHKEQFLLPEDNSVVENDGRTD